MRGGGTLLAIAGAALAAAGCGNDSNTVSCTISTPGNGGVTLTVCREVAGLSVPDQDLWGRSCFVPRGATDAPVPGTAHFDHAPCPHVGALGGCQLADAMTFTVWYYADGPYTAADIPMLCDQTGDTFVAP